MRVTVVHQPITLSDGTQFGRGDRVVDASQQAEIASNNLFAQRCSVSDHADLDVAASASAPFAFPASAAQE